jgi:hypothetical protein
MSRNTSKSRWCLVVIGLLPLAAIGCGAGEAEKAVSANHMRQIGLALMNYALAHGGHFPAAATFNANGKPLLSWRVAILPDMDQQQLYQQFHQDEPWDSPHNRALVAKMPSHFADIGGTQLGNGETCYLGAVGEHAAFFGAKGRRWHGPGEGPGQILVVEAAPDRKVIWTKPDDLTVGENNPASGLGGWRGDAFLAIYTDGLLHEIPLSTNAKALQALFSGDENASSK